jgi:hypothetical protein
LLRESVVELRRKSAKCNIVIKKLKEILSQLNLLSEKQKAEKISDVFEEVQKILNRQEEMQLLSSSIESKIFFFYEP